MPDVTNIYGFDGTQWVKILVNAAGKLIIDPSEILEDSPTDGEVAKAPTSNWAADHKADASAHHAAFTQANHDALPNPHHSNALDHSDALDHSNALDHDGAAQDTVIAGKTTLAAVKADVDIADAITKKHSNANDLTAEQKTDLTDGGTTVLHSHAGGGAGINMLKTTADQTINGGAGVFVDIGGLTFPVVNGVDYAFHFYITFRSAATATGWKAGVNCPAGVLDFWAQSDVIANGAAGVATHTERHNTVRDDMTLLATTVTAAVDLAIRIEGRYKCTANGTFAARFANELVANTQIVVQKGSWGFWF